MATATEIRKSSPLHKRARTSISRGEDDYMRGNIMKMELHNFMTYSHIESRPAPRLNLVIGPNGTGKSSLVCALAIGLGGEPQLLGRAGHIGDFVKRGEESAWIKITLRGNTADESIVITRKFNKQNKSEWLLDDRPVSKKAIQQTVQQFNIQVNNLTQFLPQDRVCEFAKMTPIQLLEETEKAVGDPELSEQHLTLIKRSQELKQRQVTVNMLQSTLSQHQQNNAELEKDVERVQQRNRLLSRAAAMRLKLPWLRYDKEKSIYKEAKDREKEAKKKLEDMKHEIARMKAPIIAQKRQGQELEHDCEEFRSRKSRNQRKRTDLQHRVNELRETARTTMAAIEELHRAEASRQHRIEDARNAVQEAEQEYANLPIEQTPREELESLNRRIQEFEETIQERRVSINELSAIENQRRSQINAYQRRKEEIQTVTNQRLEALKKSGAHKIFEAYKWVEDHRHEFKQPIYGPVLLEVTIPDKDYAAFVEGHVSYYIWKAFITQDPDDRDRLFRCLKPYGVPVINYTGEGSQGPGPEITQEMRNLGITHTLDQVVTAPDVVKKVLIGQFALNYSFIGTAVSNQRANEVCNLGIRDLWTPENHFRWKESRYGGPMSVSVDPVQAARFFTRSVDMSELIELDHKIFEASAALASLQENVRGLTSEQRRCEDEAAVFYRQREEIHNRTRLSRIARKRLQDKIVQRRGRLESLQTEESTGRAESNYRRDIAKANRSRCLKILELKDCLLQAVDDHILYTLKTLAFAEVDAKVNSMEREFKEQERTGICAQQDYDTRKNELMRCRSQLQAAKEEAERVAKITPELQADFATMPDTVEDLEDAIADHEAQARTVFCPNPNVLEEYERRCEQIRDASRKLEAETALLDTCRTDIETTQAKWLSSLKAIVAKINATFSRNFEEMAVAGEVSLDERGTDFDKYGIHIKVKFREKGELQLLSGHHQSGGERSVSTILYLISLQDLTHCPFRAVDEINQGMDPINERKMFQQLVRAASQPNTPQCFLLTPKLLPDLSYSEACSILNIMNGPWMAAAAEVWKTGSSYVQVFHNENTDG